MSSHLSTSEIENLRGRRIPVAELIAENPHLNECVDCRERLSRPAAPRIPGFLLNSTEDALEDARAGHLSYETIEAYVDHKLSARFIAEVDAHAASCAECGRDLREMQAFAAGMRAEAVPEAVPQPSAWQRFTAWAWMPQVRWGAALAALAIVFGLVIDLERKNQTMTAHFGGVVSPETLVDGSRRIAINKDGKILGLEAYGSKYAPIVREAIDDPHWSPVVAGPPVIDLTEARQEFGDSHLLLGLLEAHQGMEEDARRDLTQFQAENPNSAVAARLLRVVEGAR